MSVDVQGTFISQKINKVRWIPEEYVESKCFLTGSWDDDANSVKVWTFETPIEEEEEVEYPRELSEFLVDGDVTQIKFVDKDTIAVSTSDGTVRILGVSIYDKETPLKLLFSWHKLHNFGVEPCSCTSLDTFEGDLVCIGEDGNINMLNSRTGTITQNISDADSCSLQSVCFIKHNEIMTGNIRGHMKIWDGRAPQRPAASFLLAGDERAATALARHPTQPHVLLAGSEAGAVAVWDLRLPGFPASLLSAHRAAVTELQFHPQNPDRLLSCSAGGELWQWAAEALTGGGRAPEAGALMPGLPLPVNALDCDRGRLLCGADNEAVYLLERLLY